MRSKVALFVAVLAAVTAIVYLVPAASSGAPGGGKPSPKPRHTKSPAPSPFPSSDTDPIIRAAGDIACDPADANYNNRNGTTTACHMIATANLLSGAAAVLTLGDNQYEDGALTKYQASYASTWGAYFNLTHPVPGNHEYGTPGAAGYYAYFGTVAGDPTKGYYSYNVGAWHLIALNSNCGSVGGCGAGSAQEQWLRADLAANPTSCTLAYWHHPRFSSGAHGNDATYDAFWQALYAYNADLVLVGHDHDYERFAPQNPSGAADAARGIREFVVGTGGKSSYAFTTIRANSQVRDTGTYGVLELTLHPTSYDFRFVHEAGKTFTDSGTAQACH